MGDREFMYRQIREKLEQVFDCIKLKIGSIDFEQECELLASIRKQFDAQEVTLRVDANGAFASTEALGKLGKLARYKLHSIEQPIRQGHWEEMGALCRNTPVPVALDEELIGIHEPSTKQRLLE
jgi:L-alanine-DL-glutamate epimerase-like enolase superfamily enzyme